MIDKKWIEVLKLFNLSEYESKTYFALVINGPSTVKEVRELAGIPYSREYDILDRLENRGFVESQPGRPKQYAAVDPRVILKKECDTRTKTVENLLEEIGPLYDKKGQGEDMKDLIWTIRGADRVRGRIADMVAAAKRDILIVGVHPITSKKIGTALEKARKRGVRIRALGMFDSGCRAKLEKVGAEMRHFEHDHSRYFLIDDSELILSSQDPGREDFALYNQNPGCIKLYRNYFEHMWQDAE
jgi:sugar-specific transcriptional regulator TrmB